MGWLIDLAKAAIPEAMSAAGGNPDPLPPLPAAQPAILPALAPGVSPKFRARLSAENLGDIASGDIPLPTVQAFEQAATAKEAEDLHEHFEERSAILGHDAGLPRAEAEIEAAKIAAVLARNRGYTWHPYGRPSRDTPRCSLRCPTGPVRWMP